MRSARGRRKSKMNRRSLNSRPELRGNGVRGKRNRPRRLYLKTIKLLHQECTSPTTPVSSKSKSIRNTLPTCRFSFNSTRKSWCWRVRWRTQSVSIFWPSTIYNRPKMGTRISFNSTLKSFIKSFWLSKTRKPKVWKSISLTRSLNQSKSILQSKKETEWLPMVAKCRTLNH